jgi:uncharacterized protein YozE (UPF0346 family)
MAQSKIAKRAAREANRGLDPTLIDVDFERKNGNKIPKNKRDFSAILSYMDRSMRIADPTLPRDISPTHLGILQKLANIAFRDNLLEEEVKCPHCGEKHTVLQTNAKNEQNSVKALEIFTDRTFPKLATLTHEVNLSGQITNLAESIATIVIKFVPAGENRALCIGEIYDLIERMANNGVPKTATEAEFSEFSVTA